MQLKFCDIYSSVGKEVKLKVRVFLGLIPKHVEVTENKLVGRGTFCSIKS